MHSPNTLAALVAALVLSPLATGCSSCGHSGVTPGAAPPLAATATPPANGEVPPPPPTTAGTPVAAHPPDGGDPAMAAQRDYSAREAAERTGQEKDARAACTAFGASLTGGSRLDAASSTAINPQLQRLEPAAIPLVECLAVEKHADTPCDALAGMKSRCVLRASFAREANDAGKHVDEEAAALFGMCHSLAPNVDCGAVRDALKSGDDARCPASSDESTALCAAYVWRDAARCPTGNPRLAASCLREARWTSLLKKGGRAQLIADGDDADRALMDAAAGRSGACEGQVKSFVEKCIATLMPPPHDPTKHALTGAPAKP